MGSLGIRKEIKNKWERRVPLNPAAVQKLVAKGHKVYVQPSKIRIYKDEEYKKAGAILTDDLSESNLIIGVKEIPVNDILPNKAHLFFSHTIKGQDYNMPLLQKVLDDKTILFDYEKIVNSKNQRLVFFGKFAGNAGMVDTLCGVGQRLKVHKNISTPFLKVKPSYEYSSLEEALSEIGKIGDEIKQNGLPAELAPFVVFQLGYGHVGNGCTEVLNQLPVKKINPAELKDLEKNYDNKTVYLCVFKEKDLVERKDGKDFELMDYFNNPADYKSKLSPYLKYASIYMNAIYWSPESPVFLPQEDLKTIQNNDGKLIIIGDVTCDINGSVAATVKSTEPDNPTFIYNANTGEITDGYAGEGIADCAVDNLPCEFPREASDFFSSALFPFIQSMMTEDYTKPVLNGNLPDEIKNCCIADKGKLLPQFKYLTQYLPE